MRLGQFLISICVVNVLLLFVFDKVSVSSLLVLLCLVLTSIVESLPLFGNKLDSSAPVVLFPFICRQNFKVKKCLSAILMSVDVFECDFDVSGYLLCFYD